MSDYIISQSRRRYKVLTSEQVGRTDTITLESLPITDFPHVFLSVQYFDSNGDQIDGYPDPPYFITPTTGWEISLKTVGNIYWESPPISVVSFTVYLGPMQSVSWNANTTDIKVVPVGLDSMVNLISWQVTVTANRT